MVLGLALAFELGQVLEVRTVIGRCVLLCARGGVVQFVGECVDAVLMLRVVLVGVEAGSRQSGVGVLDHCVVDRDGAELVADPVGR